MFELGDGFIPEDVEKLLRNVGYRDFEIKIPIEYFPLKKDGTIDIEKTELICQQEIDSVGTIKDRDSNIFVVDFAPTKDRSAVKKILDSLKRYKELTTEKEEIPVHAPFTANQCPKCGANLGGKLIDNVMYENPYFETCPACGVRLKKLPWQH